MHNLSENIVLVVLPEEPELNQELKNFNEAVSKGTDYDVIISFSRVEIVTSSSLSTLIALRGLLREHQHRLILCSVSFPTRCIFKVVGLEELFEFSDDKLAALEKLEKEPAS